MWDFSTPPEFEAKLEWMREFVAREVYPLEAVEGVTEAEFDRLLAPLREQVKEQGLWAAHLPPELGGQGFGALELGLMNEISGASIFGPMVFGSQAPDAGNAELIAAAGSDEQKERWLEPLLDGRLKSAFSMTEPHTAGSDPTLLATRAERVDGGWRIEGRKWFTSNGSAADFLVVMVVTDPEAPPRSRASMMLVPTDAEGLRILRDVPTMEDPVGEAGRFRAGGFGHAEILYDGVFVPDEDVLGGVGEGFLLAQRRLGPGRIQHCMRWLGQSRRAFEMMCERAVSRRAFGSTLGEKGVVREWVADSAAEMQAARLMTLHAAWRIDREGAKAARQEIGMIKYFGARVLFNVIDRAIQVHGGLGYSTDLPLESMYRNARAARIYDGADEVHRDNVARRILAAYEPHEVPSEHVPARRAAAAEKFAELIDVASLDL
ncbi:MAG TPA: acyl-CoA dehydrogenase family protein [Solirubrobacterales bacterium]|nr:acyl-CoA dehydrogenase family protein [Solirubrobacterales bacterium]